MSFMKKVFGSKPKKATTLPEAITKLKATEEILNKKQLFLEDKIRKEIEAARKNASSNKKAAFQALQRKKRLERQLQQLDGALTTLEAQREVLENANINNMAVGAMDKASKALKDIHQNIDVDKVDKILDDLEEQRHVADDIADAISQPAGFSEENIDEDELEKELEKLTEGVDDLAVEDLLPTVPKEDIRKETKKAKPKEKLPVGSFST